MYRYEISSFDVDSLISFSTKFYVNVRAERIPAELTWFDRATDSAVLFLKRQKVSANQVYIGLGGLVVVVLLYLVIRACSRQSKRSRRYKDSQDYFKFD